MSRSVHTGGAAFGVTLLLALGCGDSAGPDGRGAPGISVASGAGVADTIGAALPDPLVVEVRSADGRARPGVAVLFDGSGGRGGGVYFGRTAAETALALVDTTDGQGRARAYVRLGFRAGVTGVVVTAPALGLTDTVRYTVRPGAPARVEASPSDTAVYLGRSFSLRTAVVDRGGNPVAGTVALTSLSPQLTVTEGGVITGAAAGRGEVVARAGTWVAAARVSVVPVTGGLALAAAPYAMGDPFAVALLNLDLSGYRRLDDETGQRLYDGASYPGGTAFPPRWDASGARVFYHAGRLDATRLYVLDLGAGVGRRVLDPSPVGAEAFPDVSRDGAWVYFSGRSAGGGPAAIWRVRSSGADAAALPPAQPATSDNWPSVSPDGARLAYVAGDFQPRVRVRVIATGERTGLDAPGIAPRWSPAGDLVAYIAAGAVHVARPDGTGDLQVARGPFDASVEWSPDGKYLLVKQAPVGVTQTATLLLELVEVASGERIPLPFTGWLSHPAWRPGAGQ